MTRQQMLEFRNQAMSAGFNIEQAAFLAGVFLSTVEALKWVIDPDYRPVCGVCGSKDTEPVEGEYPTGVVAPDGGREMQYQRGIRCRACGAIE